MIQFRQKEFLAPFLAAAGPVLSNVANGAMIASVPLTGVSMYQSSQDSKKNAEQAKAQEEQMKRQNRILKKIADNASSNPGAAMEAANVIQQRNMSMYVKRFAAVPPPQASKLLTWKNVKGLGKDLWKFTRQHKEPIVTNVAMGGVLGTAGYAANKGIEWDMRRSGIPVPGSNNQQKQFATSSVLMKTGGYVAKGAKMLGKAIKDNPKMTTAMAIMSAAPTTLGYVAERGQLKEQARQTQQMSQLAQQREFGVSMMGINRGFRKFFRNPLTSTTNAASNFFGTGGKGGVARFSNEMKKSSNPLTQKVGEFVGNHKKTALAGSALLGYGIMTGTWDGGEKAVRGVAKTLDKNAYAYDNSKNEMVQ